MQREADNTLSILSAIEDKIIRRMKLYPGVILTKSYVSNGTLFSSFVTDNGEAEAIAKSVAFQVQKLIYGNQFSDAKFGENDQGIKWFDLGNESSIQSYILMETPNDIQFIVIKEGC